MGDRLGTAGVVGFCQNFISSHPHLCYTFTLPTPDMTFSHVYMTLYNYNTMYIDSGSEQDNQVFTQLRQRPHPPHHLPAHLPTYPPTHLPTYLPTHPPTHLPTYLYLPTYLPHNSFQIQCNAQHLVRSKHTCKQPHVYSENAHLPTNPTVTHELSQFLGSASTMQKSPHHSPACLPACLPMHTAAVSAKYNRNTPQTPPILAAHHHK